MLEVRDMDRVIKICGMDTTLDAAKVSDAIEPLFPKFRASKQFPWHGWAPRSASTTNWIPVPFWKTRRQ
jgi:hypothetical protein